MITEFIGQGINDETDESAGNHICSSINNEVFTDMNFFVAFMRSKGLREMKPFIEKANREGRRLTVFVGIDEKITSKEALEMLIDLDVDAYIYNSKRYIFHPKVYLFQGQLRNRIIVGSSNLTKTGLFFNVESSVLLDFTSEDKSGMKVLNQLTDYFAPLLDFSSEHLDRVTPEHIQYLLDNFLISIEKYESDEDYVKKTHDETKERFKNPKIGELGQIEITEGSKSNKKYELKITEEYLEKWDSMFERMKTFKEKEGKTTVPRDYPDRTLYGWYRKQKDIYNHPTLKMPDEHLEKLISIDFHFEDGHKERERLIELKWLKLLKEAIDDKDEDIKVTHGYTYKGETLGTWLVGVSQANKVGNKLELRKEIEDLGFDFKETSREPEDVARRFIDDLLTETKPNKMSYQTRFNRYIKPKKEILNVSLIKEINEAWELQFNEIRKWESVKRLKDRTEEWKAFRYDSINNTEGKWHTGQKLMGEKLYIWVRKRKLDKKMMDLIIDKFSEKEKRELKNEGFPID